MIAVVLDNSMTVDIKQPQNKTSDKEFVKCVETSLLLSLLEKQMINQQQFDFCIQHI
jgi:hypothetical protein